MEYQRAEHILLRDAQRQLQWERELGRWQPWRDKDDLIRCGGRLTEANISSETKHPILLPKNSDAASLLMMQAHQQCMHGGVAQTVTTFRQKYWVVYDRRMAKKVIKQKCMDCRRWQNGPFALPEFPKLPQTRMQRAQTFKNTGLDYLGPLTVSRRGERTKK